MISLELRKLLNNGGMDDCPVKYTDVESAKKRLTDAIDSFEKLYGKNRDIEIFSVPGRSEICGNHTDHNRGCVIAGAIDRDIIAVASKNGQNLIRIKSQGYPNQRIDLTKAVSADNFKRYTSSALVAGVVKGFCDRGYKIGGFDVYTTTEVYKGSGISSSAAFEVMIGNILNYLFNGGRIKNEELAKIAMFSENVYFGKPSGLMDQMACSVGGVVYMDFCNPDNPKIVPLSFSLKKNGYAMCIVNTGGSHANLNDDYASVPGQMKACAKILGKEHLRGVSEGKIIKNIKKLRDNLGDRAVLRALHFVRENERAQRMRDAVINNDIKSFIDIVNESGHSSFEYLQNVYTTANTDEQGLSLALALTDGYLSRSDSAFRVHGGGFAGTIQVFLKEEAVDGYCALMDAVFGKGKTGVYNIRDIGACRLFG